MAIAIRNDGTQVNSRINITPMVDVMLVLLIIFMVITPLLRPGPRVDALLVAIIRDGQVFLGNEKISPTDLTQKVRDRIAGGANRTAFVKADARCHLSAVAEVVDSVRSAGVRELGLLTERRRQ